MITCFECIVFIIYNILLNLICYILLKWICLFIFTILIWLKESFKWHMWLTIYFYEIMLAQGSLCKLSPQEILYLATPEGKEGWMSAWVSDRYPDYWENFLLRWVCKCLSMLAIVFLFFPLLSTKRKERGRSLLEA